MPLKDKYLIIVAGGLGKRMQSATPKQFLELSGKPVLMHVFEQFHNWDQNLNFILVLPETHFEKWEKLSMDHDFDIKHSIVKGGKERFDSVKNGLQAIEGQSGIVGIHDGVRPLVTIQLIRRIFETAEQLGNAVPVIPVRESMRWMEDDHTKALDRSKIRLVQTPQVFDNIMIKEAYQQAYRSEFTDDATVVESAGNKINFMEGDVQNIKITDPYDIKLAEYLISNQA
ncbi:MAG: 2-C-methyl-D-erythritol 4-phosphate cytidylyltransferase [Bacteroidota bacterium]|nr:2-C-methyl-D-erythritol 4-phosphate cytidylyltransferase [Bacteroidota bacterium]